MDGSATSVSDKTGGYRPALYIRRIRLAGTGRTWRCIAGEACTAGWRYLISNITFGISAALRARSTAAECVTVAAVVGHPAEKLGLARATLFVRCAGPASDVLALPLPLLLALAFGIGGGERGTTKSRGNQRTERTAPRTGVGDGLAKFVERESVHDGPPFDAAYLTASNVRYDSNRS